MTSAPKSVAVIGAGIGGLAAANALMRKGFDVQVYEQAPEIAEVGAGVQLAPNGIRLLQRWGFEDAVAAVGVPFQEGSGYFRDNGTSIAPSVTTDSAGWNAVVGIHRADLQGLLQRGLPASAITTGKRAVSFGQDETKASVTFADGTTAQADIIVGADGIHSVVRTHVTTPSQPVHSGSVAYRGLIPTAQAPDWPRDQWRMWLGQGKHFLVFPVRSGQLLNYVGFVPSADVALESWSAQGDPNKLRAAYAGWDPRVTGLLELVDTTLCWSLNDRDPITTWTKGRFTLLGDAAHPMLPHLGQGANQAIEDAAALAVLLERAGDDVQAGLTAYEDLRRTRAGSVQTGSRANGMRYDSAYDDLALRDAELAAAKEFRWSLYDYDAEMAAQAVAI